MNTKTKKPARIGPIITLLGLALPLALMLGLAALAFAPPAEASAQTPNASTRSMSCEGGEPQLYVSEPLAAKPDGDKQPLDLVIELTDDSDSPVVGAKVMARVTDFQTHVDAKLTDLGNGRYAACVFGYFNGSGSGALGIHVRAEKAGYMPGANDGTNFVGRLCTTPDPGLSR